MSKCENCSRRRLKNLKISNILTATSFAEEFHLTESKKYEVQDIFTDLVLIENDLGERDWYSLEYFSEFGDYYGRCGF